MRRWKSIAPVCALLACAAFAPEATHILAATAIAQPTQNTGPVLAARADSAASQIKTYLEDTARNVRQPDFAEPNIADLMNRVLDLTAFEALPPVRGDDLLWLMDWAVATNKVNKAIMFFDLPLPIVESRDAVAIGRNVAAFENEHARIMNFLLRITARETDAAVLFMDGLPPADRTPIRREGFHKMRAGHAQMLIGFLTAAAYLKPGNARLVSTAFRETGPDWAAAVLPDDRASVLAVLDRVQTMAKDDAVRNDLSAFRALLARAK